LGRRVFHHLLSWAKFKFLFRYVIDLGHGFAHVGQGLLVILSGFSLQRHPFDLITLAGNLDLAGMGTIGHNRVHGFAIGRIHLIVVTSTLFFYYNVIKSA